MSTVFSLVSTPLHLYISANLACSEPDNTHHLLFIDQDSIKDNLYLSAVNQWQESPFETCSIFPGRIKNPLQKISSRKQTFKQLEALIKEHQPDEIRVGNDRRIEFQYAMHIARKIKTGVVGSYMDEGTYTYIGRDASASFSDRYIDNLIKKITYGFWWKNPPTIGGSGWINKVYAAFPDLVHPQLQHKKLIAISPDVFKTTALYKLSEILCQLSSINAEVVTKAKAIYFLPHESVYQQDQQYKNHLNKLLQEIVLRFGQIAVKYHPRQTIYDELGLFGTPGIQEIPNKANFESLLPLIDPNTTIIGDMSSVLLLSKWFNPKTNIIAIKNKESKIANKLKPIYEALNISIAPPEAINQLI